MIPSDRAEGALNFLVDTDAKLAQLEGEVRNAETRARIEKEIAYLEAQGSNIREKDAKANTSAKYIAAETEVVRAEIEFKTLKYRRQTADILIGCWRTQESSRRQGA
jgi:hypothetical protein